MRKFVLLTIILMVVISLFAYHPKPNLNLSTDNKYYENFSKADSLHGFDVLKYIITLDIDTQNHYIQGNVEANVLAQEQLTQIQYELEALTVTNVLLNGETADYSYQNGIITIQLGNVLPNEEFTTKVFYEGNPQLSDDAYHLGMFFGNNYVMTLVDPSGCRWWWPAYDHPWDKAIVDLHITIRDDWLVASNGLRESIIDNNNGTKTHNWIGQNPMATYLVVITAANYQEINQDYNGLPIQNFVSPSQYQQAVETLSNLPFMVQVYSQEYGEYPFEKYGNAVSPISTYAAMEHQTMTTLGNFIITGNHQYETTIAHELSHHWFGNCLTPLTWKDVWLSESFATYSEMVYTHHWQGWEAAYNYVNSSFHNYYLSWAAANGPHTIYNPSYIEYFAPPSYEKGASVLHMLRLKLGPETFFNILRTYFQTYKYGNVVTQDFIDVCESVSGMDLSQFFQQWIFEPGTPEVDYTFFINKQNSPPQIKIFAKTVSNTNTEFYLDIPAQINYETDSDSILFYATPTLQEQDNTFPLNSSEITDFQIDPHYWVLSRSYNKKEVSLSNVMAGNHQVMIYWNEFWDEIDIDGFNVYRASQLSGEYEKINQEPVQNNFYIDDNVENNNEYFYKVCAVLQGDYESEFSDILSATPIDFPMNQGILVIDETDNGNGTILHPTDTQVDEFYQNVIDVSVTNFDFDSVDDLTLEYIANFSFVIWHDDDFSLSSINDYLNILGSYLAGGGNLLISGWKTSQTVPLSFFRNYFSDIELTQVNQFVFNSAISNEYPDLHLDTSKIPESFNGTLPFVYLFDNIDSGMFQFSSENGSSYDGRLCAFKKNFENHFFVFLGFPLYYMNQDGVLQMFNMLIEEIEYNDAQNHIIEPNAKFTVYPNPFVVKEKKDQKIKILFYSDGFRKEEISVYNLKGEKIRIIRSNCKKGQNVVYWDLKEKNDHIVSSGIYVIKLSRGKAKKVVILK